MIPAGPEAAGAAFPDTGIRWPGTPWARTLAAAFAASVVFAVILASPRPLVVMGMAVVCVALGGIASEWRQGRLMSLDVMVYAFSLLAFGARPLFLAGHYAQLGSWDPAQNAQQYLSDFRSQEIVEFISSRFPGDVSGLLIAAELMGVVFLSCFLVGRIAGARMPSVTPGTRLFPHAPSERALSALITGLVLMGFAGQAIVISSVGGIGQALANLESQLTLRQSFAGFVLANFAVAACLLWAAFGRLRGTAGIAFGLLLAETVVFAALTGSRTRTFLPVMAVAIVVHLCRRRFLLREAVVGILCAAAFAGMFLTLRQVSSDRPLGEAVATGISRGASLQVLANDHATFDALVMMQAIVPEQVPHQDGRRLAAGFTGMIPSAIYPAKPEEGDVWFRRQLWGDARQAGRPYTLPGELWLDFSWIGLALGSLGLGLLCARLRWDMRRTFTSGQALVASVMGLVMWELLNGVWSSATSTAVEFGAPLLLAAFVARRTAAPA